MEKLSALLDRAYPWAGCKSVSLDSWPAFFCSELPGHSFACVLYRLPLSPVLTLPWQEGGCQVMHVPTGTLTFAMERLESLLQVAALF